MTTQIETRISHPCQYCNTPCFGKQCKDCHLKMVANRESECIDCNKMFPALRADGTKRARCKECQEEYTKLYISTCECGESFHTVQKNGKTFDKCFKCYQKNFTKCQKCDNTTKSEFPLCKQCYSIERENKLNKKQSPSRELRTCKTTGCGKKTTYTLCSDCNSSIRQVEDEYMISRCTECGYRGRGNFRYCREH